MRYEYFRLHAGEASTAKLNSLGLEGWDVSAALDDYLILRREIENTIYLSTSVEGRAEDLEMENKAADLADRIEKRKQSSKRSAETDYQAGTPEDLAKSGMRLFGPEIKVGDDIDLDGMETMYDIVVRYRRELRADVECVKMRKKFVGKDLRCALIAQLLDELQEACDLSASPAAHWNVEEIRMFNCEVPEHHWALFESSYGLEIEADDTGYLRSELRALIEALEYLEKQRAGGGFESVGTPATQPEFVLGCLRTLLLEIFTRDMTESIMDQIETELNG